MQVLDKYHPILNTNEQTDTISIVIAAYNIEAYIERCMNSVRGQSYRNLEIIVVDDGSTDGTGALCDRFAAEDARVHVIHKKNGGPADARNAALEQIKGSYVGFVDGDDWIDRDMYAVMYAAMKEQDADIAVCRYRQVHSTYTEDLSADRAVLFEGQEALEYYVRESDEYPIRNAVWNKLYRREILESLVFPTGKWYEDIMFTTMALSCIKRCVYLDTAYYNYIIDREGSIMNTRINLRTFTDQIPAYREKTEFLTGLGRQDLADIHDYFFYKRLLLFYAQTAQTDDPEKASFMTAFERIIRENTERYGKVFGCAAADPRDYRKMKLFLRSPAGYCRRVRMEERWIIPLKSKIKGILKR